MKKTLLLLILTILLIPGCAPQTELPNHEGSVYSRIPEAYVGWNELQGLSVTVITTPITTQTQTIELELTNQTEQACYYYEQKIFLDRWEGTFFHPIASYDDGYDIMGLLETGKTVRQSISIDQLKPGTYRFAFVQDWNDEAKQMNAYVSPAFEVTE